jgi:CRISPR-associated protein Cas1
MPENLRALPKLRDSVPYLYLERGRLTQTRNGVEFENEHGRIAVPVASLACLMLGPGTTVTHRAMVTCARSACAVTWTGQAGVRFYASGTGATRKAYALQEQARLHADPALRLAVVERMYRVRFAEPLPGGITIEAVRGHEGARVRRAYRAAAARFGVPWRGRRYDLGDWDAADVPNRALSAASACLVGVCHAAVTAAGYSPGLGFVHQGLALSFVFDVADLYKMELAVPVAFAAAREALDADATGRPFKLEQTVRARMRQALRNLRLPGRIVPDVRAVLDLDPATPIPERFDPDDAYGLPTAWWEPPPEAATAGDGAFGEPAPPPPVPFDNPDQGADPFPDLTPDGPTT